MAEDVYVKLAQYLNKFPIGAPLTDNLIEILKAMYTPDEAELATKIPMMNTDISTLVELTGIDEDKLKDMLIRMAKKGTVFMNEKGRFRLLPTLVGITETPFWAGKKTPETERLAGLWYDYYYEAFAEEVGDRETPLVRVVPVDESLEPGAYVTPQERVNELLSAVDYFSVAHCPCRLIARFTGRKDACDHSTENCFHFGSMAKYMVSVGMARELTRDEAKKLISEAHEEGLVHIADNYSGRISTMCSCCSDCCVWIRAKRDLDLPNSFAVSNYVMQVDEDLCIACGVCEDRCPVEAISVDDVSTVDATKCIGCGVCYPTCPQEAIKLVERGEREEIMEMNEFVQRLIKEKGIL